MTEKHPHWKKILPWAAGGVMLLVVLALVLVLLAYRFALPAREESHQTTQSTTTETTLPPPPANVFDPEDFGYGEDGYLACLTGPYERGVDVSSYQGNVDWQAVKDAGFSFAIIRVAGRGYGSAGTLYDDKLAQQNYEGAKAAGLKVGAYFFSQAITVEEAVEEADYLLEKVAQWELELPVVYDWEYISETARTADVSVRMLTDCTLAFCRRIEEAGREPMVYFNTEQSMARFHIEEVTDYPFWLAMYSDWMTYPYKIQMWQYTDRGTVPGIEGNVDINLHFSYEETQ